MRKRLGLLAGAVAAAVLLAAALEAGAETCTLQLKRVDSPGRFRASGSGAPLDYLYQATYPQHFYGQLGEGAARQPGEAAFAKAIRKEPAKYQSENPFRAVAKVGSEEYGFVLDASDAKSGAYNRLYFDFNHNGDLTDDKPVDADKPQGTFPGVSSYCRFPRLDVTLAAGGEKVGCSFFLTVYSQVSAKRGYVSASLNAAAYREGRITLDGKPRHVVLIDFNSNGRFDDPFKIREDVRGAEGQLYPEYGDVLMIDPEKAPPNLVSAYDPTGGSFRYMVSKLVNVDGRYYQMEISPAGDRLTLSPAEIPLGYVTNPNENFQAVIYGDTGFLKISADKSKKVAVPAGRWRLFSYTIDGSGEPATAGPETKKEPQTRSLLQAIASVLRGEDAEEPVAESVLSAPRRTLISAQGTANCKPLEVKEGQTAALGFGPPFKPVVSATYRGGRETVYLGMSLIGSAGERCTNVQVDGRRPDGPQFTITTVDGKEVDRGKFEYG